jgi:hypothetical protein
MSPFSGRLGSRRNVPMFLITNRTSKEGRRTDYLHIDAALSETWTKRIIIQPANQIRSECLYEGSGSSSSQQIPRNWRNTEVHYRVCNRPTLALIMSHMNSLYIVVTVKSLIRITITSAFAGNRRFKFALELYYIILYTTWYLWFLEASSLPTSHFKAYAVTINWRRGILVIWYQGWWDGITM